MGQTGWHQSPDALTQVRAATELGTGRLGHQHKNGMGLGSCCQVSRGSRGEDQGRAKLWGWT